MGAIPDTIIITLIEVARKAYTAANLQVASKLLLRKIIMMSL